MSYSVAYTVTLQSMHSAVNIFNCTPAPFDVWLHHNMNTYTLHMMSQYDSVLTVCTFSIHLDSQKETIRDGMRNWEDKTCIRFKKRTTESQYVTFRHGDWYVRM